MKKFISIILLFALLLTCCACGNEPEQTEGSSGETEATDETVDIYADIDETVPVDGVYQIHSVVGVQNMVNHPDADFELLRDIDLAGAVLTPVGTEAAPFTGEFDGGRYTISNFTVQASEDANVGFFGVLEGSVKNLNLADVTVVAGANSQNIGSLAGVNNGTINRCTLTGTLRVEQAGQNVFCGSAVGVNTGSVSSSDFTVDLSYTASGSASIGGLAGAVQGGEIDNTDTNGKLDVTGGEGKTVGLLVGTAKDATVKSCAFVGQSNTVDGKLFNALTGAEENSSVTKCLWRDNDREPLSENVQALRDKVVEKMYEMGSVMWNVSQDLRHSCTCSSTSCYGIYNANTTYRGIPYNHKGGSMNSFNYCLDENNVMKDFVYEMAEFDGYDAYIGNDCSTSVLQAWWSVSNSVDFIRTRYQYPHYNLGTIAVGDWASEEDLGAYSVAYVEATGEQEMYEAYAQMRKGDSYMYYIELGGHTRMVAEDPVVVRDQEGKIDPTYSYVLCHEQGAGGSTDEFVSTWRLNYKYTFANLYYDAALPVTCEELLTGEMEPVECELLNGAEGKVGLTTGIVQANYYLDNVNMVITNAAGETVMDQTMFTTAGRYYDADNNDVMIRNYCDNYDLANFATPLQQVSFALGETYHCTITANLATGDSIVVSDFSFVNGEA